MRDGGLGRDTQREWGGGGEPGGRTRKIKER